jgi:hypothetical protein
MRPQIGISTWRSRAIGCRSERCVRPDRVVVAPPALDADLGLAESLEDFTVEQLVAQASVVKLSHASERRAARSKI